MVPVQNIGQSSEQPDIANNAPASPVRWDDPHANLTRVSPHSKGGGKSNNKGASSKAGGGKSFGKHRVGGSGRPSRFKKPSKKKAPIKPKIDPSKGSFFGKR